MILFLVIYTAIFTPYVAVSLQNAKYKNTVVKAMRDFARCAVEVARVKDLSKDTVVVMMKREMGIGAIEFDTETEEDILVFTHTLATKAGLY